MIISIICSLNSSSRSAQAPMTKSNSAGISLMFRRTRSAHFWCKEGSGGCSEGVMKLSSGRFCAPSEEPDSARVCGDSAWNVSPFRIRSRITFCGLQSLPRSHKTLWKCWTFKIDCFTLWPGYVGDTDFQDLPDPFRKLLPPLHAASAIVV